MNISLILIEKNGNIKQQNVRGLEKDIIYKKCGFRKNTDFNLQHCWKIKKNNTDIKYVELWAKNVGKAGQENKYELPPPTDTALYFGTIAVLALNLEKKYINLNVESWEKIYNNLFGGFEDLTKENEEYSEDELKNIDKEKLTKTGYLKDGFVIDDKNDEESCDYGSELEEEEYYFSENE